LRKTAAPSNDSIQALARRALEQCDPLEKLAQTQALADAARSGRLHLDDDGTPAIRIETPGRPARPLLVPPRALKPRGLGTPEGRAALIHAVAHIEFNAINLALDAVYRFRAMPAQFHADWISVAEDEARHFRLLCDRLSELGHAYGDLPAHDGLWQMALRTDHDVLVRMALVPRVLEARGLDVTPGMIERLRRVGDERTIAVLEVILREELRHVAIGSHWFEYCCRERALPPSATFLSLVEDFAPGALRGPYNFQARALAGFRADELAALPNPGERR